MEIKIFVTGGTIDGLEYDSEEKAPRKLDSSIPKILKEARLDLDFDCEVLFFKDSKFITDRDREVILDKCKNCSEDKIVITHGTMAMPVTAKFLGKANPNKTIVLVGSAIPSKKEDSDAKFNIGFALAAIQMLPKGVYITMNGNIFPWNNVKKNMDTGMFEKEG